MESLFIGQMMGAMQEGDAPKFLAYTAIFVFIWIEVRGLKKEVANLNATIAKSFTEGEHRFKEIEIRLMMLETQQNNK